MHSCTRINPPSRFRKLYIQGFINNGENVISFVNESLYIQFAKSTWWIDSGATVHVANSLQGFRSTRTTLTSERHIKVANGVQAEVEAVGDVSLELVNGFILCIERCFIYSFAS